MGDGGIALFGVPGDVLYFESVDCSGQPLILTGFQQGPGTECAALPDGGVLRPKQPLVPQVRVTQSYLSSTGTCTQQSAAPYTAFEAEPVALPTAVGPFTFGL